ncbi:MAG: D-glycero-beta-D-manno-heptose 1-phosphate adenylyltransferase [Candidatus Cloacimonetes bacterium]|nr:D-glycero-beta-D-manno-heptose 1-phosphate adenylyltransferase [Candidatus Cloacimonadota bacterium]
MGMELTREKLRTVDVLEEMVRKLQKWNKKIVFTNGCFDIIHAGHIKYLYQAKSFGDVLIIGLNSDASVRRIKGEERPINKETDRALVLAALEVVDYIVIFEEDTPYELIKKLSPNVLVKGGDWLVKDIVGSEIVLASGGEVKSLPYYEGHSTTNILKKLKI